MCLSEFEATHTLAAKKKILRIYLSRNILEIVALLQFKFDRVDQKIGLETDDHCNDPGY